MALATVEVRKDALLGFKALPGDRGDLSALEQRGAITDWSAVYPQLTLEAALSYLPNWFERGFSSASLVALTARQSIALLVLDDRRFQDGSLNSAAKADIVRSSYDLARERLALPPLSAGPLMTALGERGLALAVRDAEDFELVVPHALFTPEHLTAELLFAFDESASQPLTVGRVHGLALPKQVLSDHIQLAVELARASSLPSSCSELHAALHHAVSLNSSTAS
jgi:hypothetical protein